MKTRLRISAAAVAAAFFLASCGNTDSANESADFGGDVAEEPAAIEPELGAPEVAFDTDEETRSSALDAGKADDGVSTLDRKVISQGMVVLSGADLGDLRLEVRKLLIKYNGEVQHEQTQTGDKGEIVYSELTIRVPSKSFDAAMEDIAGTGKLQSTTRGSEDVTTQVIDNEARIRAQSKSLARMESLLVQAKSLQNIIAIESQVAQRQAELDSLKSQQQWLSEQTSMSTIQVILDKQHKEGPDKSSNAFVRGIKAGWKALGESMTALLTIVGGLLPFAIFFALIGWPLLWGWRKLKSAPASERPIQPQPQPPSAPQE